MCVCVCVCVCLSVCLILCVCKSCPAEDFIPRLKAACHILTHSWMHSLNYNCESCSNMTRLKQTLRSCYRDELRLKKKKKSCIWLWRSFLGQWPPLWPSSDWLQRVHILPFNVWRDHTPLTLPVNHCRLLRWLIVCCWHNFWIIAVT